MFIQVYTYDNTGTWEACYVEFVTFNCLHVVPLVSGLLKCKHEFVRSVTVFIVEHLFTYRLYVDCQHSFSPAFPNSSVSKGILSIICAKF